jgi:hypothetical protein
LCKGRKKEMIFRVREGKKKRRWGDRATGREKRERGKKEVKERKEKKGRERKF